LKELRERVEKLANPSDALSYALRRYFSEPSEHQYTPVAFVRDFDGYASEYQAKQASRQRGIYNWFMHLRAEIIGGGGTPPDCAAWFPEEQLRKFQEVYPDVDPATVRLKAPPVKAEPEQRGGDLDALADLLNTSGPPN